MERKGFYHFYKCYAFLLFLGIGLLIFGSVLCTLFHQNQQFMTVNAVHSPISDNFFRIYTHIGDGLFMAIVAVLFVFKKFKYGITTMVCFLLSGLLVQILKKTVKLPRPGNVFAGNPEWHTLPNYDIHDNFSFPSGHTTTSFALMTAVYYIFPNQRKSPLLFLLACLAGYSRVYLSQHWPVDVFVGALLGTSVSIVVIYVFEHSKWYHKPWMNQKVKLIKH